MSRLSFLDLAFFLTESEASPKHVAGLSLFKKPPGSAANWVHKDPDLALLRGHPRFDELYPA